MNEEHFLTELAIYLKPLSPKEKEAVLHNYQELFAEKKATGLTEEMIAKSLGKPKDIAKEILSLYEIPLREKKLSSGDWEEFDPNEKDYQDIPYEAEFPPHYSAPRRKQPGTPLQKVIFFFINFFLMFWVTLTVYLGLMAAWITVIIMIASPLLSIFSFLSLPFMAAVFQLFVTLALLGGGFIGIVIGRPITKFFHTIFKKYWRFNKELYFGGTIR